MTQPKEGDKVRIVDLHKNDAHEKHHAELVGKTGTITEVGYNPADKENGYLCMSIRFDDPAPSVQPSYFHGVKVEVIETAPEQDPGTLTPKEFKMLEGIRHRGFAVIVWTPEELGEANPRKVEDRSIELGHEVIRDLQ